MLEIVFVENDEQFLRENSEQFYLTKKGVNYFLNNAEQKIILCRMLEIVYAKNNEQFF